MIQISNLSKKYGETVVFSDLNYTFENACIYGLVGRNGAGKTTLLNILHHFTTLQMISLSANQPFYGIHQPCRFYSCFDVFDETDVKYLFLNFLADEKTEVLYAFTAVCGKIFFLIRQQFHCAVADIDQVD